MKKFIIWAITFTFLVGCTAPIETYKASGAYAGEQYTIDVEPGINQLNPTLRVRLNGKEALSVKRTNKMFDPHCKRGGVYIFTCRYETEFKGMKLTVLEKANAQMYNNSLKYEIYLDGQFVQTVVAK